MFLQFITMGVFVIFSEHQQIDRKALGTALAGLRLRHKDAPNAHPLLIQNILTPQVPLGIQSLIHNYVYSIPSTFNKPDPAGLLI
jgi:hypothetical protein